MLSKRALTVLPKQAVPSRLSCSLRLFSHSVKPLAYEVHEPPQRRTHELEKPILLLHGLFGSKANFRGVGKALAHELGRYVYALDLRNHGESPQHIRHDYLALAEDVVDFIHEERLSQPTLIGHSMGAKTAMTVALHSPDLLADMIAVDNAPVAHILEDNFAGYIEGMHKVESANVTRRSQADKILEEHEKVSGSGAPPAVLPMRLRRNSANTITKSPVVRQFLLGNLDRLESDGTLRFRIPLHILGQSWQNLGHFPYDNPCETEFDKPALFIRGTQSNYITDDDLVPISQFFPNFSLTDIDAGHWVISKQPEAFTKAVVAFLQSSK
ncbi:hypothetical protein LCI18_007701 [Fusarium solani-melongenae]|uniref:Uncharacterized protein n=1 Tax=Fusarium solani subsp. cucurbitae TaxID=2747967 RepID=A0ACD3Z6I5_FUSSC|nr:hypothetical protein LCI18_007701 [Fusarium solani-melongenae]